ncbi:MAG: GTPase ObgE [Gemmatimonadetes bacterium]|nr:GTPase ObgE [Gemmatimonadota bacterium]
MFIDLVVVHAEAGAGGSGVASFRREKFYPMGGPDGGDGGRGGDVIVRADANLATLLDFTYRDKWIAERGQHGSGNNKTGRSAETLILPVPPGTTVRVQGEEALLGEVLSHGDELVVAKGGRGGKGNAFFATATHQSPREWQPGEDGELRTLELELKLIADVGLVGQPNAGKSTLLSVISAARPKIADYPFTTLKPNLGVVALSDHRTFVVADIPGIIEGAHEGKGLGLQFLRHIERTRLLAFLIPIDAMDWQAEFDQLRHEVLQYSPELAAKPFCVVFTKLDLLGEDYIPEIDARGAFGLFCISAPARTGLDALKAAWWTKLLAMRKSAAVDASAESADDGLGAPIVDPADRGTAPTGDAER